MLTDDTAHMQHSVQSDKHKFTHSRFDTKNNFIKITVSVLQRILQTSFARLQEDTASGGEVYKSNSRSENGQHDLKITVKRAEVRCHVADVA